MPPQVRRGIFTSSLLAPGCSRTRLEKTQAGTNHILKGVCEGRKAHPQFILAAAFFVVGFGLVVLNFFGVGCVFFCCCCFVFAFFFCCSSFDGNGRDFLTLQSLKAPGDQLIAPEQGDAGVSQGELAWLLCSLALRICSTAGTAWCGA